MILNGKHSRKCIHIFIALRHILTLDHLVSYACVHSLIQCGIIKWERAYEKNYKRFEGCIKTNY